MRYPAGVGGGMMITNQILIVDDEVGIRELLSEILTDEGYQVRLAENAEQARRARSQARPDLVLLDIWMPDTDGITLLKEWASAGQLTMPVVMMSGHGSIDTAVEATRIGAFDFLEKPIALQKLLATVVRALARGKPEPLTGLTLATLGKSGVIADLRKRLDQVANLRTPILLTGEPGAGAEICARFLHRPNTPWVEPESQNQLAEAPMELLEQAREGVLFAREVGDLGKLEQKGLLLLSAKLDAYDARLVCATSRPLARMVAEGAYDPRLFEALASASIGIPPLREHREDVPDLAGQMLTAMVESGQASLKQWSTAALNALRNYDWPGNLAQLNAVVSTLALTSLGPEIGVADVQRVLKEHGGASAPGLPISLDAPLREARDRFETLYLEYHMRQEDGNMSRVAEKVGLERTHLYRKLKQLGIRFGRRGHEDAQ
jgi:two-component system, NtrC family, nitrogen regulation response regulator NtrX